MGQHHASMAMTGHLNFRCFLVLARGKAIIIDIASSHKLLQGQILRFVSRRWYEWFLWDEWDETNINAYNVTSPPPLHARIDIVSFCKHKQ